MAASRAQRRRDAERRQTERQRAERQRVAELFRTYGPQIVGRCRQMLGETPEAQDVAQDTFAKLWLHRDIAMSQRRTAVAWIYITATRAAIDRIRARKWADDDPDLVPDHRSGPERVAEARQLLDQVVEKLTEEELEMLIRWRIDGLSQPQIGRLLRKAERTVRRRIDGIKVLLRRLWEDDDN